MNFNDTPEESEFRREVTGWIANQLRQVPNAGDSSQKARELKGRWWQEAMHENGWTGISWPEEYGGRGLSKVHEAIFNEESARVGAPTPINILGLILAGPTILIHGTEKQRQRYLPQILSAEEIWCQGFSEPGAGSDLAGLRTNALWSGNAWIVNGQKVWTSFAHFADRCMLLARTNEIDPQSRHNGITYFLSPMEEIEVRPLVMINGDRDFNEMFLNDVLVAEDDVLGDIGGGWRVALTTLGFERSSLAFLFSFETGRAFRDLVEKVLGCGLQDDPEISSLIGSLYADMVALRVGTIRHLSEESLGDGPNPTGSILKLSWASLMQRMTRLAMEIGGPEVISADTPGDLRWIHGYLRARANSIEGGTDEIQRSIIAERILGLPRSR